MGRDQEAVNRCPWAGREPIYLAYHDEEWGVPKTDDRALFEKLVLEGFQAGLSWITILKKREHFRTVFDGFEPGVVAGYGPDKVEQLMGDAGIVRNRAKIEATVNNARACLDLQEERSLASFLWDFVDGTPQTNAFRRMEEIPAQTPTSQAMATALKARGFRFCGPTTAYAFMQSVGMVNDHLIGCHRHGVCSDLARDFALPEAEVAVMDKPATTGRAWQRMLSGRRLDLLNPSPLDIEIEDIAHGLARVARWNGQTIGDHALSVAQHSLLVEQIAGSLEPDFGRNWRLAALLHDGPEYVMGDLISPFKSAIGLDYKALEGRLLEAIHIRFGLPPNLPKEVTDAIKRSDKIAAYIEATRLAGFAEREARKFFTVPRKNQSHLLEDIGALEAVSAPQAQAQYLERYSQLTT